MTVNGKNGNYQLWALEYTHQYHGYKDLAYRRKPIPQRAVTASFVGDARKNITLNFA